MLHYSYNTWHKVYEVLFIFVLLMTLFILVILAICFSSPAWAQVVTSVDRNPIKFGESVNLSVQCTAGEEPDFSILAQGFEVLRQNSSNNVSIINGSITRKKVWTLTLMPKRIGDIIIPALGTTGTSSSPLQIRVLPANAATPTANANQQDIMLEVFASTKKTWVQAQILLTVRLLHKNQIALRNASLTEPKHDLLVVKKLGEDKRYAIQRSGIAYQVIERRYALLAQQSGMITLPALRFEGLIAHNANRGFDPFGQLSNAGQIKRVQSQAIPIEVQAKPTTWKSLWLPASNIIIREQWPTANPEFRVGEPVTRTLEIIAHGLTAAQLPDLMGELPDSLRQYPDKAELHDGANTNGLVSQRKQAVAIVPEQQGSFMLPAISLPWWNTATAKVETATLAARMINVLPALTSQITNQKAKQSQQSQQSIATQQELDNHLTQPKTQTQTQTNAVNKSDSINNITSLPAWFWPALVVLLIIGWIGTIVAYYKRSTREVNQQQQLAAAAKQESLRKISQRIKTACNKNNASNCREALLVWSATRWKHAPPLGLTDLANACDNIQCDALANAARELNNYLYTNNDANNDTGWHGANLWIAWQQAEQLLKLKHAEQAKIKPEALQALS
ncbi:MAG: BatD family protein [Mariprofundales bacterium]